MTDLTDACPVCQPGVPPASLPVGDPLSVPGGVVTAHECVLCGAAWETFWREGWPVDRMLAPVSPDQAARNRAVLGSAGWPASRTEAA
jgi:hypothetical protein